MPLMLPKPGSRWPACLPSWCATTAVEAAVDWAARIEFRWLAHGVALELRGDDIGAAGLYRAVLRVRPDNREAQGSLGRLKSLAAKSLRDAHENNQTDAVVAFAHRLLDLDPQSVDAHFALGR